MFLSEHLIPHILSNLSISSSIRRSNRKWGRRAEAKGSLGPDVELVFKELVQPVFKIVLKHHSLIWSPKGERNIQLVHSVQIQETEKTLNVRDPISTFYRFHMGSLNCPQQNRGVVQACFSPLDRKARSWKKYRLPAFKLNQSDF